MKMVGELKSVLKLRKRSIKPIPDHKTLDHKHTYLGFFFINIFTQQKRKQNVQEQSSAINLKIWTFFNYSFF